MLHRGLIADYRRAGVVPTADDAFNLSLWRGYESEPDIEETLDWFRMFGASIMFIPTSGHASPASLRAFASSVRPQVTAPVHAVKWDKEY